MPSENELTRQALDLVSAAQLGLLMTTDDRGYPHGRWMHLLPMHGLRRLYALTAGGTRKLDHIAHRPQVAWIVTGDQDQTVLLKGVARIDHEAVPTVWDRLAPVMQQYAVGPLSDDDHLDLVAIETRVESGELICPPLGVRVAQAVHIDA